MIRFDQTRLPPFMCHPTARPSREFGGKSSISTGIYDVAGSSVNAAVGGIVPSLPETTDCPRNGVPVSDADGRVGDGVGVRTMGRDRLMCFKPCPRRRAAELNGILKGGLNF